MPSELHITVHVQRAAVYHQNTGHSRCIALQRQAVASVLPAEREPRPVPHLKFSIINSVPIAQQLYFVFQKNLLYTP